MEFAPLIFLLVLWFCMGVFITAIRRAAKSGKGQKNRAARPSGRTNTADTATQENADGGEQVPAESSLPLLEMLKPTVSPMRHDDSLYQGSLNAVTGEGYDPCHDEQMAPLTLLESEPAPDPISSAGPRLIWSGNEIVQGIVMSEILNRKQR